MQNETEVRTQLLAILARLLHEPPKYAPDADIFDDFGLDSLDQIEFVFGVEEKFGVKIEDETFEEQGFRNFDKLVAHLVDSRP
jgi:acyl carrier protein